MSNSKEGWLKIKLQDQTKWHRRYCTVDWDRAVLFIASRADTRYRHWIKLAPDTIINDYDHLFYNEASNNSNNLLVYTIEIKADGGAAANFVQAENKTEYDSWLLTLKRTAYSRNGGGIFGQSLDDTYKYSRDRSSLVPLIVRQCCEFLLEHGSTFVGLFRVPGKQSSIREIRDMYDRGLPVELKSSCSPATISSLLKIYLQALPEPIIPMQYFDDFFEIGSRLKYSETNDSHILKHVIETKLSNINYAVLAYICLFLKQISDHSQVTKMNTDNIAVVFGNNLIRPAEKLDLNMVKGHSCNLLPLIKALIDQSEYLFSGPSSTNQLHESYEQTTESITKSSGCSSFSSVLSSNDHPITNKSRSTSMPSIRIRAFSSYDSLDFSPDSPPAMKDDNRNVKLFVEKKTSSTSEDSNNRQPRLETKLTDHQIFERDNHLETKSNSRQKRFAITDFLDANQASERIKHNQRSMDNILAPQQLKLDCQLRPASTADITMPLRRMEKYQSKKSFANKFGKSFSTLKSSMSKALQSHTSLNENDSQAIDSPTLSVTPQSENRLLALPPSSNSSLKKLQSDVELLKDFLDKKDLIINELTRTSRDQRMQFEKEIFQLNQKIEQLQYENMNLQKQLNRE